MTKPLTIKLKTLTPLWTGGVDQTCDRLHETGLIGSLRWWYEALVRGLGGYACDPTSRSCEFDSRKANHGVCEACQVFGTTGLARKIRVVASGGSELFQGKDVLIPSGRIHQTKKSPRPGGWYLFGASRVQEITVRTEPLRQLSQEEEARLKLALELTIRHGAVGGKVSNGYGVVAYAPGQAPLVSGELLGNITAQNTPRSNESPDLRDFFFMKYEFNEPTGNPTWWHDISGIAEAWAGQVSNGSKPISLTNARSQLSDTFQKGILPLAPAIRNWLRYHWRNSLTDCQRHFIFGEAQSVCPHCCRPGHREDKKDKGKRWCPNCQKSFPKDKELPTTAAKIYVSYAYRINQTKWQFRVCGWLPCKGELKDRDDFLVQLRQVFQEQALWSHIFRSAQIAANEISWLSLDCEQQDGLHWLKRLLPVEGTK